MLRLSEVSSLAKFPNPNSVRTHFLNYKIRSSVTDCQPYMAVSGNE